MKLVWRSRRHETPEVLPDESLTNDEGPGDADEKLLDLDLDDGPRLHLVVADEDLETGEADGQAVGGEPLQISHEAMAEVEAALERYGVYVEAASVSRSTKQTYLRVSRNFVLWLKNYPGPGTTALK